MTSQPLHIPEEDLDTGPLEEGETSPVSSSPPTPPVLTVEEPTPPAPESPLESQNLAERLTALETKLLAMETIPPASPSLESTPLPPSALSPESKPAPASPHRGWLHRPTRHPRKVFTSRRSSE